MGVEKVLVSKVILLVALWSPVDLYVFTEPKFETEKDCVEYVMEHQDSLNVYLMQNYNNISKMVNFYCIESEKLKSVLDRKNKPQI